MLSAQPSINWILEEPKIEGLKIVPRLASWGLGQQPGSRGWQDLPVVVFFCSVFFTPVGKIFMWLFLFVCFLPWLARSSCGCFFVLVFYPGWQDLHGVTCVCLFFYPGVWLFCLFVCFYFIFFQEGALGSWKITCVMQNSGLGVDMLVYLYHMLSASSRPGALVLTRKHQAGWWVHHLPILHHHQTHHINMFGEGPIFGFWRTTNCAKYKKEEKYEK